MQRLTSIRFHFLAAAFVATVLGVYAAVLGLFAGVGSYLLYVSLFEGLVMPSLVPPGGSSLSYGQEFAFIMTPLAGILGAGLGISAAFAIHGRRLIGAAVASVSALWVARVVTVFWMESHSSYAFDPSDWILYVPLLIAAAISLLIVIVLSIFRLFGLSRGQVCSNEKLQTTLSTKWLILRMTLLLLYFEAGFACFTFGPTAVRMAMSRFPQLEMISLSSLMVFAVVNLLATPFLVAGVIWFHAMHSTSDGLWSRPTHKDNPFLLRNPLRFLHLASFLIAAAGLGGIFSAIINGMERR